MSIPNFNRNFSFALFVELEGVVNDMAELGSGKDSMFAFAVNSDDIRPASTSLEVISSSVKNFELNKSPGLNL